MKKKEPIHYDQTIYVIQTFEKFDKLETGWPDFGDINPCGFFPDKESAFDAMKNNKNDINENGAYPFGIIEAVKEGIFPSSNVRWFFMYNEDDNKYMMIEEPKFMQHICGLTM